MKVLRAILVGCTMLASSSGFAQRSYLRGAAGWNFPFLTQTVTGDGSLYAGAVSTQFAPAGADRTEYKLERASFGAGGAVTLAAGIFITDHIGLELAAQIGVLGPTLTYTATEGEPLGSTSVRTVAARAERPIILCPAIVYRTGGGRVEPYLRAGPVLPLHTDRVIDLIEEYRSSASFNNYTIAAQAIESSRFSVGLAAAVGVSVPLWARASLFAECSATALQVYVRKRTYTSFFYNSEDITDAIPESVRTTWYEMDYVDNGTSPTGSTVRPAYSVPFSSLGVSAGISVGW